jgi:hypothetical protein
MPRSPRPAGESQGGCVSEGCPSCGRADHVTLERVIVGFNSVTRCHCRACGQSWTMPKTNGGESKPE